MVPYCLRSSLHLSNHRSATHHSLIRINNWIINIVKIVAINVRIWFIHFYYVGHEIRIPQMKSAHAVEIPFQIVSISHFTLFETEKKITIYSDQCHWTCYISAISSSQRLYYYYVVLCCVRLCTCTHTHTQSKHTQRTHNHK